MRVSRGSAHVLVPAAVAFLAVIATSIRLSAPTPPPTILNPGDTAVIHGPRRYDAVIGSSNTIQTFVDSIPLVVQAYHRFVIRVKNGNPDGTERVQRATVGSDSVTGTMAQVIREIAVQPTTLITVKIRGQASAGHLTIELLEIYGGNYTVFHEVFTRTNTNSDVVFTRTFTHGGVDGPPFFVWILNGNSNGTSRLSNVTVRLNNDTVVGAPPRPNLTTGTYTMLVQVSLPTGSNTLVVTLPKKQAGFIDLLVSSTDVTPPTLKILAPPPNLITRLDSVNVIGTVTDPWPSGVSVNGIRATITADTFRLKYGLPLVDGPHLITVTAVDPAGNRVDSTRTVNVDRTPPTLTINTPQNGFINNHTTIGVNATIADASPTVSLYMNGVFLNSCQPSQCSLIIVFPPIPEGPNTLVFMAKDSVGNTSTTQVVMGTRDTQRPTLTVTAPADSSTVSTPTVTVTGTASDAMLKDVKVNGVAATLNNGAFSRSVDLAVGQNTIVVIATDSATNADTVRRTVTRSTLPPDPATVATPINPTVATNVATSTAFLYTGANPIQTGVAPGTIDTVRGAVLRGKVLSRDLQPLGGATIRILGHPEFGQTLSRADGMFDMVVNGGGKLTVDYQKSGYLGGQRTVDVTWQDFTIINDVVLVALDPQVTTISFAQPIEVARGTPATDEVGTRQTTLFFQQGTHANMVLPDSTIQPLTTMHVRATEYTVGRSGPAAMPAALPPTSGYTYAAELSADEATAAGALRVEFDKPVIVYLENFLEFPVGTPVPLGIYNRQRAVWEPLPNGRIIKVLSTTGGVATVGIDTTGQPASDSILAVMGITTAERGQLASVYQAGQELWRMPTTHFSPIDGNYPAGADTAAKDPNQPPSDRDRHRAEYCLEKGGSVIECENQILGERIPIAGTGMGLNYRNIDMPAYRADRIMRIHLRDSVIPPLVREIDLVIDIAGQRRSLRFGDIYNPAPFSDTTTSYTFEWDGKDAYGRTVNGAQIAKVAIGYFYQALYLVPPDVARSFGLTCFGPDPGEQELPTWEQCRLPWPPPRRFLRFSIKSQTERVLLGGMAPEDVGRWTVDAHHSYDPLARVLHLGTGEQRSSSSVNAVIKTAAGNGQGGSSGDGGLATNASVQPTSIAVAPDGALLIADATNNYIRRVGSDGRISTIAGNGSADFSGDGVQALQTGMDPADVKVAADASIYLADSKNHRIRRIGPDGVVSTVAGTTFGNCDGLGAGDGGPATSAPLCFPYSIALGPDGSFYIADTWRVRRVDAGGTITTVAGIDRFCDIFGTDGLKCGDGLMAVRAPLNFVESIDVGPDGSVYIVDDFNNVIRRVTPDGVINTVAGNFGNGFSGDGGPAKQATLRRLDGIAFAADGGYYITDRGRIRRITPDGIIYTVAGGEDTFFDGDGGTALQAHLNTPQRVVVAPDGSFYICETFSARVRHVAPPLPGFSNFEYAIASEDGAMLYRFDAFGKHLRTLDATSGALLASFNYDTSGSLSAIIGPHNDTTRVERATNGTPTAIVAPFGQRTTLSVTADGLLGSVTNPAGESYTTTYHAGGGLLARFTNPRGYSSAFGYDSVGRLVSDSDAANGIIRLARLRTDSVTETTYRTPLGRLTSYRIERFRSGFTRSLVTNAAGQTTTTVTDSSGRFTRFLPTGDSSVMELGADPRWGMQSPIINLSTISTPGGLQATITSRRHALVSDPENPLTITSQTDSVSLNGNWTVQTYDASTRVLVETSPENRQAFATFDSLGRVVATRMAGFDSVRFTYNNRGQLSERAQGARVWTFSYDGRGRLQSTLDPLGRRDSLYYDDADRLIRHVLFGGRVIAFSYDSLGNMKSATPPGRPAHVFEYTPVNLTSRYAPPGIPGPKPTLYFYNLDRQVDSVVRPDSVVVRMTYDTAGRLKNFTFDRGAVDLSYSPATGNLVGMRAPSGDSITYAYDGRFPTRARWVGTVNGQVDATYNNDFRISSQTVNGSDPIAFAFDRDGMLVAAGGLVLGRSPENGSLLADTIGQLYVSYAHSSQGELSSQHASFNNGSLLGRGYVHDSLGRIVQVFDTIQGIPSRWSIGYDSAGRLVRDSLNGVLLHEFSYDQNGNRLSYVSPNGSINYTYDDQDRLLTAGSASYVYASSGNLKSKTVSGIGTTAYTYDALGNLISVSLPSGSQIDYVIDAANRRIGRRVNGVLTQAWLYQNKLNIVAELDGSGNIVSRFVYGSRANVPDYMVKNGATYRLISDHLGSVRLVVDVNTGAVAQRLDYDEWGVMTSNTNPGFQPFGFAGGLVDDQTGLVRFGARDYDPSIGRWTTRDPLGVRAGIFNSYAYADDSPITLYDPTGLQSAPPPPGIPGGPWSWFSNPTNNRGGAWRDPVGNEVTWDPSGHWDYTPTGGGPRVGFDRWGNELAERHVPYRGPTREPLSEEALARRGTPARLGGKLPGLLSVLNFLQILTTSYWADLCAKLYPGTTPFYWLNVFMGAEPPPRMDCEAPMCT